MTHTAGPWTPDSRAMSVWAEDHRGKFPICDIRGWGHLTGKGHGALGLPETEAIAIQMANARLIAAAPKMLSALREVAVIAEQHVHDLCAIIQEGGTLSAVDKMELRRWQSVGEAIAKAEGDKP